MTYISDALRRLVRERADNCCEYCRLSEEDNLLSHEVDHIIAEKHRGKTEANNLCLACFDCNRFKGSDIASLDPETEALTPIFNPRIDRWDDHFQLDGAFILPLTPVGRVTEFMLQMNAEEQLMKRRMLIDLGRYPCT